MQALFFFCMCANQKRSWSEAFLADTMETGDKNRNITARQKPCIESLGKINAKINQCELFRNRSVHKFYCLKSLITLEQVTTSVAEKRRILI